MVNQEHRNVTEMEVDGVIYRETKILTPVVTLDGKEEQEIVCTRSIGDKSYSVRKIISVDAEFEETNMPWNEVQAFEEDWSKNWNPVVIPTPRVFSTSMNNSWMSTFGQLFCWAGLVLVLVLVILLVLAFLQFLEMHRSNMWI